MTEQAIPSQKTHPSRSHSYNAQERYEISDVASDAAFEIDQHRLGKNDSLEKVAQFLGIMHQYKMRHTELNTRDHDIDIYRRFAVGFGAGRRREIETTAELKKEMEHFNVILKKYPALDENQSQYLVTTLTYLADSFR